MDAQQFWNWFWIVFAVIMVVWMNSFFYSLGWHRGWNACQDRYNARKRTRFLRAYGGYVQRDADDDAA